jgi:hypothetical protein
MSSSLVTATDVADVGSFVLFAASLIFIIGYSRIAPWWRYAVGRAVVSLDIVLAVTLLPSVIRLAFHLHPNTFFVWYAAISLFFVSGVILWRLATIRHVQLDHRNHVDQDKDDHDRVRQE